MKKLLLLGCMTLSLNAQKFKIDEPEKNILRDEKYSEPKNSGKVNVKSGLLKNLTIEEVLTIYAVQQLTLENIKVKELKVLSGAIMLKNVQAESIVVEGGTVKDLSPIKQLLNITYLCKVCKVMAKKKCKDCSQHYCSKECQKEDWEKGHKEVCKVH